MPRWSSNDHTGLKYGDLTVLKRLPNAASGATMWECLCSCGHKVNIRGQDFRGGRRRTVCDLHLHSERLQKIVKTPAPQLPVAVREVVPEGLVETVKEVLTLARETEARSRVLFTRIHNLQTDLASLTKTLGATLAVLQELFNQPQSITEAQAIVKDFLRQQFKDSRGRDVKYD